MVQGKGKRRKNRIGFGYAREERGGVDLLEIHCRFGVRYWPILGVSIR